VSRGLRTLGLRMARHNANALALARLLEGHPKVAAVHYPGLASSPFHARAAKLLPHGCGGVFSFGARGRPRSARCAGRRGCRSRVPFAPPSNPFLPGSPPPPRLPPPCPLPRPPELTGGVDAAEAFQAALTLPLVAPSLGGVETLVTRPAATSHAGLDPEERRAAGIADGLVRVAVGVEDTDDLLADFAQALEAV
jgi:cystathionine beta-lyase/cystathionine gamma-synthase